MEQFVEDAFHNKIEDEMKNYMIDYTNDDVADRLLTLNDEDDEDIQDVALDYLGKRFTDIELDKILTIKSREILVLYSAFEAYESSYPFVPGTHDDGEFYTYTSSELSVLDLIDPIIYVMQFSQFPDHGLGPAIYRE